MQEKLENIYFQHFSCLRDQWIGQICKKSNSHKSFFRAAQYIAGLAVSSKNHHEISISCIFLKFLNEVGIKNVVKFCLWYTTTLETYCLAVWLKGFCFRQYYGMYSSDSLTLVKNHFSGTFFKKLVLNFTTKF